MTGDNILQATAKAKQPLQNEETASADEQNVTDKVQPKQQDTDQRVKNMLFGGGMATLFIYFIQLILVYYFSLKLKVIITIALGLELSFWLTLKLEMNNLKNKQRVLTP